MTKDIKKLKKNDKRFLTQQDKISKQLTDLGQESKVSTELYKNHDRKIEDNEKRIGKLELKTES